MICAFGNETHLDDVTLDLRNKIHSLVVGKSMINEHRAMYPSLLSSTTISGISHNKVNHDSVTTRVSEVQEPKCPTKQQPLSAAPSTSQPSRLEAHNRRGDQPCVIHEEYVDISEPCRLKFQLLRIIQNEASVHSSRLLAVPQMMNKSPEPVRGDGSGCTSDFITSRTKIKSSSILDDPGKDITVGNQIPPPVHNSTTVDDINEVTPENQTCPPVQPSLNLCNTQVSPILKSMNSQSFISKTSEPTFLKNMGSDVSFDASQKGDNFQFPSEGKLIFAYASEVGKDWCTASTVFTPEPPPHYHPMACIHSRQDSDVTEVPSMEGPMRMAATPKYKDVSTRIGLSLSNQNIDDQPRVSMCNRPEVKDAATNVDVSWLSRHRRHAGIFAPDEVSGKAKKSFNTTGRSSVHLPGTDPEFETSAVDGSHDIGSNPVAMDRRKSNFTDHFKYFRDRSGFWVIRPLIYEKIVKMNLMKKTEKINKSQHYKCRRCDYISDKRIRMVEHIFAKAGFVVHCAFCKMISTSMRGIIRHCRDQHKSMHNQQPKNLK